MLERISPVLSAALGVAALSCMDALIKHANTGLDVFTIAFWRYAFAAVVAALVWRAAAMPAITMEMWRAHFVRGCLVAGVGVTFFYALAVLPLAEAITYAFIAPLLIPFATWALTGERVRPAAVFACLIGFAGVAVAVQGTPEEGARHPDYLMGVASALIASVLYALNMAMLRKRAGRDGVAIVGLLQALIPMLILAPPAFMLAPPPTLGQMPLLAMIGFCGATGWLLLINAYARAEAQRLAPLDYTGLVWAGLLGYVFFAEIPRVEMLAGAILVVAAVSFNEWSARRIEAPIS